MTLTSEKPEFEHLVNDHYKKLYYFGLSLTKSESDAADLTQNTFLKLAKNWNCIQDFTKIKNWLFSTLYRDFLNTKRKSNRYPECDIEICSEELFHESERVVDILDAKTAHQALLRLKESLRVPLSLYYFEHYSYLEIAQILDIPKGTVMSRIHRGKQILNQMLSPAKITMNKFPTQTS